MGAGIRAVPDGVDDVERPGLTLTEEERLPFLLASRLVSLTPEARPVFSEGLASSYEAFLDTRAQRKGAHLGAICEEDDQTGEVGHLSALTNWYLDGITSTVRAKRRGKNTSHPKVSATVDAAVALWCQGEKVVIFCHYVATGRALRDELSRRLRATIIEMAVKKSGCRKREAEALLGRIGRRFDKAGPARDSCVRQTDRLLREFPQLAPYRDRIVEIVIRFVRTPSFLVRYVPLRTTTSMRKAVERAFRESDGSGMSLAQVVTNFLKFLADRVPKLAAPNDEERIDVADEAARYLAAVDAIQTGSHIGKEAVRALIGEAASKEDRKSFVANVRLINGATRAETRHRLMLAFNTPFYPEILIASNVMAEGVDLHMNCRYVIHHDMSWNPSSIEQRTGRVDRIGAKAEVAKKPIHVFLPFVAETQDERMFRVVRDRESWFQVVMGSEQAVSRLSSAEESEKIANRIPLPKRALHELKLRLGLPEVENGEAVVDRLPRGNIRAS